MASICSPRFSSPKGISCSATSLGSTSDYEFEVFQSSEGYLLLCNKVMDIISCNLAKFQFPEGYLLLRNLIESEKCQNRLWFQSPEGYLLLCNFVGVLRKTFSLSSFSPPKGILLL